MRVKFSVLAENVREGVKDNVPWKMASVSLVDASDKPAGRLNASIIMEVDKEDFDLLGKLQDNKIEIDVTEIRNGYKGRPPELHGRIVRAAK